MDELNRRSWHIGVSTKITLIRFRWLAVRAWNITIFLGFSSGGESPVSVMFDSCCPLASRIVVFIRSYETHIFARRSRLGRFGNCRRRHWLGVTYLGYWLRRFGVRNLGDGLRGLGDSYLDSGLPWGGLRRGNPLRGCLGNILVEEIGLEHQEGGHP
jgi:hypothetical protein